MSQNTFVFVLTWVSIFSMIWLMIFRIIPRGDLFLWGIFLGLLIVSLLSSTSYESNKPKK